MSESAIRTGPKALCFRSVAVSAEVLELTYSLSFATEAGRDTGGFCTSHAETTIEGRRLMMESSQRRKVMIVDDSEIVLAVTQYALESAGYQVIAHPRPAGCITLILQEEPDLLLIDVNMPGLNGDTVVKMLGSTQSKSDMVVLLHSSLPDEVLAQKAIAVHAHGYVRKSDNPQSLIRQINRWMRPSNRSGSHTIGADIMDQSSSAKEASRVAFSGRVATPEPAASKILLADHEMVKLSDLRRLLASQPGSVEFALSGKEVLRRIQSNAPPDVVLLGWLISPPGCDEVVREALRLSPRWRSRFIIVHDNKIDAHISREIARLSSPITELALRGAIQNCMQFTS